MMYPVIIILKSSCLPTATYQPQPYISKKKRDKQRQNTAQQSAPDPVPPPVKKKKKEEVSLLDEIQALVKQNSSEPPPDAEELVKRLCDLEHSASSDAAVREKIAALPPEVSDIQHLSKISDKESAIQLSRQVDDACLLLSEYNKRLGAELEERKLVGKMLREFISAQKDQLKHTETKLQEYKSRLTKVTSVRQELQSHLQKLPDLTLLPDITGGLAPLPTAGDLFSVDQRF
ncbi:hypothetical protein KUTeg_019428 [Tegillarca granosa]|uniref:RPRD1A/B C-terminal domain-containing protein n=1 Tax=Tegillarca granosa TaxID=220873 RepID=A0ABQ9EGI9_TEGGR|nr:hypothetical protein KUTeg_019428 [Tegillarca granosa]